MHTWPRLPQVRCVFSSPPQTLTLDVPQPGASGWRVLSRILRSPWRAGIDSLCCSIFPATCLLCDKPVPRLSRVPVCDLCWIDLSPQAGPLCLCCGEALGAHAFADADRAPGDWLCRPCRVSPPHFERAVAHGLYRGTLRALLHLLKYEGMEPVAGRLGEVVAGLVMAQPALPDALTVVAVPLYRAKQRQRGFNQAELLARAAVRAARAQGRQWTVDSTLLARKRATESQAGLTPRQRRANLRGAFFVPGSARDPAGASSSPALARLKGKDVLLIDDIYTTGATARAASLALREGGAASVWVATAAAPEGRGGGLADRAHGARRRILELRAAFQGSNGGQDVVRQKHGARSQTKVARQMPRHDAFCPGRRREPCEPLWRAAHADPRAGAQRLV